MDTIYLFQSSPAPRRGRYVCFYLPSRLCNGFNPRPHQGAGATFIYLNMHPKIRVSILARTKARALHLVGFLAGSIIYVSILARTKARALPGDAIQKAYADGFQSSPAPRRGRYPILASPCAICVCFNPRPHQGAGATRYIPRCSSGTMFQSSPAPRRGRYWAVEPLRLA